MTEKQKKVLLYMAENVRPVSGVGARRLVSRFSRGSEGGERRAKTRLRRRLFRSRGAILADTRWHTIHSDGVHTPKYMIRKASELGLKVVAKTDHDEIAGTEAAMRAGKKWGVVVIPGAELDAEHHTVHAGQ